MPIAAAQAQQAPRIGYVYPAGGRQGSTFQVTVGGASLDGVTNVHVSGAGVSATVLEHTKPLSGKQATLLRDELKQLQGRRATSAPSDRRARRNNAAASTQPAWSSKDEARIEEIRKQLFRFDKKPSSPAIAETVTLQVTMTADAEPGQRELRLVTPNAITNPLVFCVGQLPEFSKPQADGVPTGKLFRRSEAGATPPTEMEISLPAIVNGQTLPGGVDRFRFKARKGERLVAAVSGQALIPYLPDAVPGWFQPVVALYDAKGKQVAYDDDFRFHPDPVLSYQVTEDGEYALDIWDAVYRGREDFVYRIAIGELPFVTSIFPLGCKAGTQTPAEVRGWNLMSSMVSENAKDKGPGVFELAVRRGNGSSNLVPFAVDDLPECLEKEPNNTVETAQPVTLPITINGRIARARDWDVFRIEGHSGEKIVAEVYARRLESPLDSVLKLTDASGKQLAFNDDHEDKGAGLTTHHADSYLAATLPADGAYYVTLGDAQDKGGPEYAYRLRISAPRPDFELRVAPSSINVRPGASSPLTVYALRKDGFAGEIKLSLKDAPADFGLSGGRVPAGQDQVRLTVTVPPSPSAEPVALSIEGRAKIDGAEVVRPAVPAEDMMQAFAYRHLVPAKELLASGSERWGRRGAVKILSNVPVKIPAGGTARVQIGAPTRTPLGEISLELNEPPDGVTIQSVSPIRGGTEIVLKTDAAKVAPGLKGNLIVNVLLQRSGGAKKQPQGKGSNAQIGTLPAIPFEIAPRQAGAPPLRSND
jgi:hypothetical protein